jgi:hypothetical protein
MAMRERDFEEFSATSDATTREALAWSLVERFGANTAQVCVVGRKLPIAICGMIEVRPNVISLLFYATDELPTIIYPLTKFVIRELFEPAKARGVHRIECATLSGHKAARRWLEVLGLSREATLHKCGKNGEDFEIYAWVSP